MRLKKNIMLDNETKRRIDTARDILVGKVPDPKSQVEQITIALIYKFMDDMDAEAEELGGKRKFFSGEFERYGWKKLMAPDLGGFDVLTLYAEAIQKMNINPNIPQLFRDIFKNAYLPYRDPETLKSFLKIIDDFEYTHSEKLGDAFEYLLSVLGSQGDAGQFRTPRHIIDFMVEIIDPKKDQTILDPACGTAGFLISSYKHILKHNSTNFVPEKDKEAFEQTDVNIAELSAGGTIKYKGDKLTPDERAKLSKNIKGYDISPDMVRLSLVNLYLHGFTDPKISEYDTLTSEDNWNEYADIILANPPFMSPKGGIKPHKRFLIQSNRSEVLFVDYMVEHLTPNGKAAIIVPEGIIFQSGNAYKQLRKMLVENYLFAVVSLPAGVFQPYSGVKTSILLIDKALNKKTDKILFIKIENDGFDLGAQRRPNNKSQLPTAVKLVKEYISHCHAERSRSVNDDKTLDVESILTEKFGPNSLWNIATKEKIAENDDWNLSGERYKSRERLLSKFPMVKLGDVAEYINGFAFKPEDWGKEGKPIIRIQNLTGTSKEFNYTTRVDVPEKYIVRKNDLLISWSATIGFYIWQGDEAFLNQHIFKVLPKDIIIKDYLFFLGSRIIDEINKAVHGITMTHITKGMFDSIQIPLPPLEIQKEIVAEIKGWQKIIDGARQVVENYKPQIDIDPKWPMVELGEVCDFSQGVQVDLELQSKVEVDGFVRFLRIENYTQNSNDFRYIPIELGKNKNIVNDDIVVVRYGASAGFIGTGFEGVLANNLFKVQPKDENISKKFLYHFLSSDSSQNYFNKSTAGGAMPALSFGIVKKMLFPIPPIEQQNSIVMKIEEEQKIVNANKTLISLFEQKIKDKIAKVWGE